MQKRAMLPSLILGGLALGLAACAERGNVLMSSDDVKAAGHASGGAAGAGFTRGLAREYAAFAASEQDQYDYGNADYFAKKSMRAAQGEAVPPETLERWKIPATKRDELAGARTRLAAALDGGARERAPDLASRAQARYDCWMEQQEENWQIDDIAACRGDFQKAMAELDAASRPAQAASPAATPEAGRRYQVFFDFDRATLTPAARRIVDAAAAAARQKPGARVEVTGKTDTSGSPGYNERLSRRRADAVVAELVSQGVPRDAIAESATGESQLPVPTRDQVKEARNRVTEVTIR